MRLLGSSRAGEGSSRKSTITSRTTLGGLCNIRRLRAFWTLGYLKLYLVAFLQAFIAFGRDSAVMDEHIRSSITSDEAITFGIVEPFHRAFQTFHFAPPRARLAGPRTCLCPLMPFCGHAEGLSRRQKDGQDIGTSTTPGPALLVQPKDAANRLGIPNNALAYPLEGLLQG